MRIIGLDTNHTSDDQLASKSYAESGAGGGQGVPIGAIVPFAGSTIPSNFLLCDGTQVSRTTYATLFSAISTTYGVGNGSTTFNLPDLRERHPIGRHPAGSTPTLGASGGSFNHTHTVPNHSHTMANHTHTLANHTHAMSHSHDLQNHKHNFNHSHTIPSHGHVIPGHYHSASLTLLSSSHTHTVGCVNTGSVGTSLAPRSGDGSGSAGSISVTNDPSHAHTISGTVGVTGFYGPQDADFDIASTFDSVTSGGILTSTGGGIVNNETDVPSSNATSTYSANTGGPSSNTSGAPSTNSTSTDGGAVTGSANAPYLVLNFIIRAV